MKLADLYIQTSYVESQSITIYDALALKQLIVTTNLPALNDALQQGELGVLCSPEKKIFVEQIKNLLFDRSTRNKLTESIDKHEVNNNKTYKAIEKLF